LFLDESEINRELATRYQDQERIAKYQEYVAQQRQEAVKALSGK